MTLIELATGLVIVSVLLVMGVSSFSGWMQNVQIRTAAESMLNGLQLARAEAVRRNAPVQFSLPDTAGKASWTVGCSNVSDACPDATIQSRSSDEGGDKARVGANSATALNTTDLSVSAISAGTGLPLAVQFNSMGRISSTNLNGNPSTLGANQYVRIDVTHVSNPNARRMVVLVSGAGQARMCDPALTNNSQGCQ